MKTLIRSITIAAMAVLSALSVAQGNPALQSGGTEKLNQVDSAQVSKLLVHARTHAKLAAAKADVLVAAATQPSSSYQICGARLAAMTEDVNELGKLNSELLFLKGEGSPWQQIAITRINLHVRTLADQLTETIQQYNAYPIRSYMPPFNNQLRATYDQANNTAELISNFVEYGQARANASSRISMLEEKLNLSPAYQNFD